MKLRCLALILALLPLPVGAEEVSLMITGATVLTMDAERTVHEDGVIVIDGPDILAVGGPALANAFRAETVIDADGHIALPGMVNTHNHIPMVAFRGLAERGIATVEDRLFGYFFPLEAELLNRELIRIAARHAAIELAMGGVTTIADMYYHEDEVARAVKEVGLRGVLGQTVIGFPVVDAPEPFGGLDYARDFIEDFLGDPLITPAVAPHAPYTVPPDILLEAKALADAYGVPVLLHMAEFASEAAMIAQNYPNTTQERSVVEYLDAIGFLDDNVVAAHAIFVSESDRAILRERGVGLAHNPKANTKDMSGLAPAFASVREGLDVGLGTDGPMSSNQMDILSVMGYAARVARVRDNDISRFEPDEIVAMATIGGAQVLDMEERIGSLEPGKRADIILVSTAAPNMQPIYDPYAALVFSAYPSDVATTIVHGEIVMRDRQLLTVDRTAHDAQWAAITQRVAEFAETLGETDDAPSPSP